MEETIIIQFPNQAGSQLMQYRPKPGESDNEIALRMSNRFRPGTVLGIDGAKWRVEGPSEVTLVYDPIDGLYPKGKPDKAPAPAVEVASPKAASPKPAPVKADPAVSSEVQFPVGSEWRPRDPRRKSSFKVEKVEDGHVITNDGRSIQIARMSRYDRV